MVVAVLSLEAAPTVAVSLSVQILTGLVPNPPEPCQKIRKLVVADQVEPADPVKPVEPCLAKVAPMDRSPWPNLCPNP